MSTSSEPRRRLISRLSIGLVAVITVGSFVLHADSGAAAKGRSFAFFQSNVAPVLAETCSAKDEDGVHVCHGRPAGFVDEDVEVMGASESGPQTAHAVPSTMLSSCAGSCHGQGGMDFSFALDPSGGIATDRQQLLAFEKARKRAKVGGPAKFARLLRMPLGAQGGGFGLLHGGGEVFESAAEPGFGDLAEWVSLDNEGRGAGAATASEAERFFGDEVLPVLARNTCLAPGCHIFNHSAFIPDPGMPSADLSSSLADRFSPEQVSFNRMTSRGLIQTLVHLGGDPEQSRILRKVIPLEEGGVLHRGGNDQFLSGPADPDYRVMARWLELEREEAIAPLRIGGQPIAPEDVGRVQGVVFVRTRTDNHRRYLDVGKYLPGGDLYVVKLAEGETLETATADPVNLTAQFHPGAEADVREPDVRYDGRAVAFAMRVGEEDNLNLYEILLDDDLAYVEGSFRRLTYGPETAGGAKVHFTDPTYIPDAMDTHAAAGGYNLDRADLVFSSNIAGEVERSVERAILGEADGGTTTTIEDLDRPEASGSFVGRRVHIVDGTNQGSWRTIVAFDNHLFEPGGRSTLRVDRPFPEPIDDSTIYTIEREAAEQPGFLPSYSVYGIKYPPAGHERLMFEETISRITCTPGQELDLSVRSTGEVFYAGQRSGVDKEGRPVFHMTSCRRHLDTRFSFPTHHGNRSQVLIYADNHELPTGIDIHVGMDPDNLWEGGNLSTSDHQFGPGLEARNPHDYATGMFDEDGVPRTEGPEYSNTRFAFSGGQPSHPRFMFKKSALFPLVGPEAVSRTGVSPGGIFRDPFPLPDGRLLVSWAPGPIDHLDPDANPDFDVFVLAGDPALQPIAGKGDDPGVSLTPLAAASASGFSDVQAVPVVIRPKPKINAGKRPPEEHLIRIPGLEPDNRPARYLERNYLLIDAIMRDPSPVGKQAAYDRDPITGEETPRIDRVKYVRFVEVLPMTAEQAGPLEVGLVRNGDPESTLVGNGIHPRKRIVGEAALHEDGSIFVKVPSMTPLIIQSVNEDGMALRQEARYYYFAPNEPFTVSPSPSETFQTCGACMGSMDGKPESLFGPVNPFSGQGQVMAIEAAADGGPPQLGIAIEDRLSIDFERDVQPVLDQHCTACHDGDVPAAGLSLSGRPTTYYTDAYESLMALEDEDSGWYGRKKYVSERDGLAIESYLAEKLFGRELKATRTLDGDHPHPSPELLASAGLDLQPIGDEELLLLVRWMDLGASFRGPDPGETTTTGPGRQP